MKRKVTIQPWKMAKMRKVDFDKMFELWKKENPSIAHTFNNKEFASAIGQSYAEHLINSKDTREHSGIEFANMIANVYNSEEGSRVFFDCAFCVQRIVCIQRLLPNDPEGYGRFRIKYKKDKTEA